MEHIDPGVNLYDPSAIEPPVMTRCIKCLAVVFDNEKCECEKWGRDERNRGAYKEDL